jgi:halimadienyl-diphosphate synthase
VDPIAEAKELVQNLSERMGPSAYDVAWMARLQNSSNGGARWPDLIEWLLENQRPDGSWGGEIVYYHDRVISTLAAATALRENGASQRAQNAIKNAERFLWHHMHLLSRDPFELSGFELIFPTLLAEAQAVGLNVPIHTYGYKEIQTAKLRLIPPQMFYSPNISTVYSLEFMGRSGDPERMRPMVNTSGSLGNSPATTAYYLWLYQNDQDALAYLEMVRNQNRIVTVYPFRIFELAWVLYSLSFCRVPLVQFADQNIWNELQAEISPTGVALDPSFGVTDGDITSVCCRLLLGAGYDVDPLVLAHFEDKETRIFRTYNYERNISVSTNIHAFDALKLMPNYPNAKEVRLQIIIALLDSRQYDLYWTDKWHASPYYATSHALVGLLNGETFLVQACHHTIDWLIHTQRQDGSWGFYQQGTAEETAYVLTALLHYNRYERVDPDILHRGADYLVRTYQGAGSTYPELWLAKTIYAPCDIVRSAILAALILYSETFGRLL